jgi:hypothetical protein
MPFEYSIGRCNCDLTYFDLIEGVCHLQIDDDVLHRIYIHMPYLQDMLEGIEWHTSINNISYITTSVVHAGYVAGQAKYILEFWRHPVDNTVRVDVTRVI